MLSPCAIHLRPAAGLATTYGAALVVRFVALAKEDIAARGPAFSFSGQRGNFRSYRLAGGGGGGQFVAG